MQMLLICTTILPIYGSCMFIVTNYHLWLVVLCERPSFPSLNRMFVEKYHLCELGIRWLHYVTVNVYCCLYNLVYSFSLLYLFLQTIYTFYCTSVALPFSANTPSKADHLSPHHWCSDRHPGGFTHQLPNQNLTVQKSLQH